MATSVEQVVNESLRMLGSRRRIGFIYEGSEAAKAALDVYGQTRDQLIRSQDWPFARRANVKLTLLKGPPPPGGYNPNAPWDNTYPPPGWLYEYAYPSDCLEFCAILRPPAMMFNLDPKPSVWRVDNDNTLATPGKVILSNVVRALAVYRARVTDPSLWEPGFTASMIESLAAALSMALAGSPDLMKADQQTAAATTAIADRHRG